MDEKNAPQGMALPDAMQTKKLQEELEEIQKKQGV